MVVMRPQGRTADRIIAALASVRHGVVTYRELLAAGVTPAEIRHRVRVGALIRVYPGVYRVGHRAPSVEAGYLAAVCACGPGALLAGRAAASLHGLVRGEAVPPEVVTPTERRIDGIRTRRCRGLDPRDRALFRAIPVTTVPRTLVDLAAVLPADDRARSCHEAGVRYRTTPAEVEAVLERRPSSPGAATLRSVMRGEVHVTLSTVERAFLALMRSTAFPYRSRTGPPAPAGSTAAGRSSA